MNLSISGAKKYIVNHKKIFAGVIVGVGIIGYVGFSFANKSKNTMQNVRRIQVTRGSMKVTVTGTGTVQPTIERNIGPDASGTVKKVYVKNGDKVKAGQVLIELDQDSVKTDLDQARLDLQKAEINLDDYSDELTADSIRAPFSGRIINLQNKKGDNVTQNSVIATLQDDSQLIFNMPVDSSTAKKTKLYQKVEVFLPDQGNTVEGKVISKNTQSVAGYNGQTRNYLKVAVPASGNLSTDTKAFGSLTINGKKVDALSVATMEWINKTEIKATLSGKITGLNMQEGQVVKKGQLLCSLSSESNAIQKKTGQLSYDQAKLKVAELEDKMNDLILRAPIDGIVSGMNFIIGDEVSGSNIESSSTSTAASKSLGKVISLGQMEVSFPVDEVDIAKVKIGQEASVTVDSLPDKVFKGKVMEIAEEGEVTNNVSSFDVTIALENGAGFLKSGMTANVTIEVAKKDNALLVPIEAIQERNGKKFVIVPAGGDNQQGRKMQPIEVGLTNDTYAEITKGLKEGDAVLMSVQSDSSSNNQPPMMGGPGMGGNRRSSSKNLH